MNECKREGERRFEEFVKTYYFYKKKQQQRKNMSTIEKIIVLFKEKFDEANISNENPIYNHPSLTGEQKRTIIRAEKLYVNQYKSEAYTTQKGIFVDEFMKIFYSPENAYGL